MLLLATFMVFCKLTCINWATFYKMKYLVAKQNVITHLTLVCIAMYHYHHVARHPPPRRRRVAAAAAPPPSCAAYSYAVMTKGEFSCFSNGIPVRILERFFSHLPNSQTRLNELKKRGAFMVFYHQNFAI